MNGAWRLSGWLLRHGVPIPEPLFAWLIRRELHRKGYA